MKTERELFEEWFESSQINCKIADLDLTDHEDYWGAALEFSWEAWQAATQRDGFKLVPVEPTQEMLDKFPEVVYQDTYQGECSIWVDDKTLELGYKAMIGVCDD